MKRRRETNLDRIKRGLEDAEKPPVVDTINQGGYAQKTMTQPPEADQDSRYDIDLGVVFEKSEASGPRTTRNWVRNAIASKATNMKYDPETKMKCVRVVYSDGYQCDFPVFRRSWTEAGWKHELSAGDEWVTSDPAAMNKWIETHVSAKSPETSGSYQLRRIIRLGKFYAKTHAKRLGLKFPGGLIATALFIEAYIAAEGRDDESFRETLRILSHRSKHSPVYADGVQVSDDKDTDRIGRLIEQAKASVEELDKLNSEDAGDADAKQAWKKVFRHSFFDSEQRAANNAAAPLEKKSALGAGLAAPMIASAAAAALTDAEKADRAQAALEAKRSSGGGNKPWAQ